MFRALLVLVALAAPVLAQQTPPKATTSPVASPAPLVPTPIVQPKARITRNVVILLDVSGSMNHQIPSLIAAVNTICGNPGDLLQIKVILFRGDGNFPSGSSWISWPAPAEPNVPEGWATATPQTIAVLTGWVMGIGTKGSTKPDAAIDHAMRTAMDQLTVVFVTDGVFDSGSDPENRFQAGQRWRDENKLDRAVVLTFGAGSASEQNARLKTIGKEGGGGYWLNRRPSVRLPERRSGDTPRGAVRTGPY